MSEERVKRWMPPHRFKFRVVDVGARRRARAKDCLIRYRNLFIGQYRVQFPFLFVHRLARLVFERINKNGVVCFPAAIVNDNLVVHRIAGKNPSGLKNFLGNRKYGVGSVMERGATRWRWTRILHGECDDSPIIPFRVALSCATEGNEGRLVNMSLKLYA